MKKFLKFISLILAAVIMAAAFAGCGNDKQTSTKDRITLSVGIFERGDVPAGGGSITDNAMTKWIQEQFGEPNNLNLKYVPIPRSQETAQLNVLLASGEAPDIVFTYSYDLLYNYYVQGGLLDITPYMDKAGELKKFLGEEVLRAGQFDGKQMILPSRRLIQGRQAQLIRQDWLDKLGLGAPATTEELYKVLKAFKEKDPGNVGDKLVPFALAMHTPPMIDIIDTFIDYTGMTDAEKYYTHTCLRPGFKDGLRFLNKLYNEGLISPDFALDKDRKQAEADLANGFVGFYIDDLGRPLQQGGTYNTLKANVPSAKLSAVDTFANKEGKYIKQVYSPVGLYIAIPKTSKNGEAAIKYLNWMAQPDVLFTIQNGFEGVSYTLSEEGQLTIIESEEAKKSHWYNLGFDLGLIVNGKYFKNEEKILAFNSQTVGKNSELYIDCYNNSIRDGYSIPVLPSTDESSKYGASLNAKFEEIIVKGIMAPSDSFDSVVDGCLKEYKEIGAIPVMEAAIKKYNEIYGN